ncbi:MAG: FAD-dependent oxidoreductase [Bryobacterales bacterium]|nr:FAD-dependent oxidoreductase [Bryobacterales bacterium]
MILALLLAAQSFDVVVYGGTPGGIAASIAAARMGHTVALVEYQKHFGGMTASGLGKSDIENREAIGGLFREFTKRVHADYVKRYGPAHSNVKLCRGGYYYEPSAAERVFNEMLAGESRIRLFPNYRLKDAIKSGTRVTGLRASDRATGAEAEFTARVLIDASYEGDLAAASGVAYRTGRESRAETNELHAGVVYQDYETRSFLPGTTGEGDKRLQAYTYRLCLTTDPANQYVIKDPPPGYDRREYLGYLDDVKAGRMGPPREMKDGRGYFAPTFNTAVRALSIAELPNSKTDVNMNPRPLGFPFAEVNYDYADASWEERERIAGRIRNLTLGLLYFLQNDSEIPAEHRALARKYHLAKDEFSDNQHFPWQLYIREARRVVGEYTLSEHDLIATPALTRARIHADSIAAGEFPIDSFPVRKREKGHDTALEGYILMLDRFTQPYQIPYRVIVPKVIDGLLVPVAASATHVAFSTIRMEPTWMALGQAAGTAAHLAIRANKPVRAIDTNVLQHQLLKQGQVLTYFKDIDRKHPAYAALQYFGTKGFFPDYQARADDPLDYQTSERWLAIIGQNSRTKALLAAASRKSPITRGAFCVAVYPHASGR